MKWFSQRLEYPNLVIVHLDHGDGFDRCIQAARAGYTSVMIDGSHVPFEDNIALTASVTKFAGPINLPVEAELGKVGGKEDDGPAVEGENPYTDPDQAEEFVARTNCTSLAVGVGTAHGVYHGTPHIEQGVLKAIRQRLDIPLVLHGTSGVPDDQVAEAIQNGICKVNYATELRQVFTAAFMKYMSENPGNFDPKKQPSARIRPSSTSILIRRPLRFCFRAASARLLLWPPWWFASRTYLFWMSLPAALTIRNAWLSCKLLKSFARRAVRFLWCAMIWK